MKNYLDIKTNESNGVILWSQREDKGVEQAAYSDIQRWRVPFVLTPEATCQLVGTDPQEAQRKLHTWMWPRLSAWNTKSSILGSSYGASSWGIKEYEYVPGAPGGHMVVYSSTGIGD